MQQSQNEEKKNRSPFDYEFEEQSSPDLLDEIFEEESRRYRMRTGKVRTIRITAVVSAAVLACAVSITAATMKYNSKKTASPAVTEVVRETRVYGQTPYDLTISEDWILTSYQDNTSTFHREGDDISELAVTSIPLGDSEEYTSSVTALVQTYVQSLTASDHEWEVQGTMEYIRMADDRFTAYYADAQTKEDEHPLNMRTVLVFDGDTAILTVITMKEEASGIFDMSDEVIEIARSMRAQIPDSIYAEYKGPLEADTEINDSSEFEVTARYAPGEEFRIYQNYVVNPATLTEGETASVQVIYNGQVCALEIPCETSESETVTGEISGVREEFREMMSGYEEILNEFLDFMKQDKEDRSLMDSLQFLSKLTGVVNELKELDKSNLTQEELQYLEEITIQFATGIIEVLK